MKTTGLARLLLAGLTLAIGLHAAEIGLEFTGYVRDDKGLTVALKHTKSGDFKWLAIGQEFQDYTVARLDEKTEILTLVRGGAEFHLPLTRAKVQQKDAEPPPELKQKVLNNLRQLAAAADQYYLENGRSTASYDDLVGPTKYVKGISPVDGEDYHGLQFTQGRALRTTTSAGYIISYEP